MRQRQPLMSEWEILFEKEISKIASAEDPAHDLLHFKRVVALAKKLGQSENARMEIVTPAAWLHDFVLVPKNDPRRSQASRLSAHAACEYLQSIGYTAGSLEDIAHAIECHSYSAGVSARTLEARVVQDADRLDALGAIGIARCFATAGLLKTSFYSETDPFCETRELDDRHFTIDHFYKKLFRIAETLQTTAGKAEGKRRVRRMTTFLGDLAQEI